MGVFLEDELELLVDEAEEVRRLAHGLGGRAGCATVERMTILKKVFRSFRGEVWAWVRVALGDGSSRWLVGRAPDGRKHPRLALRREDQDAAVADAHAQI